MLLISANPPTSRRKRRRVNPAKKAVRRRVSMARHRSAAQKAATRRLVALNRSRRTKRNPGRSKGVHHNWGPVVKHKRRVNPSHHYKVRRRHHVKRNPGLFGGGGLLGEIFSKNGLMEVGAIFAAPMAIDFAQSKIMPSASGWTRVALNAALAVAGAFAIDKLLKQRRAAVAFGASGLAVCAADAIKIGRGQVSGLSADEADLLARSPASIGYLARGGSLGEMPHMGLAAMPTIGLADDAFGKSLF